MQDAIRQESGTLKGLITTIKKEEIVMVWPPHKSPNISTIIPLWTVIQTLAKEEEAERGKNGLTMLMSGQDHSQKPKHWHANMLQ